VFLVSARYALGACDVEVLTPVGIPCWVLAISDVILQLTLSNCLCVVDGCLAGHCVICTCQISVGIVVATLALFLAVRELTFATESKRWWARAIVVMIECGRIGHYGLVTWSACALSFSRFSVWSAWAFFFSKLSLGPVYQVSSPFYHTCDAINRRGVFLPLLSVSLPTNVTSTDSYQTFSQFTLELSAWTSTNAIRSDFTSICQRAGCNSINVTAFGTFYFIAAICAS
jgi:hypothetical protein